MTARPLSAAPTLKKAPDAVTFEPAGLSSATKTSLGAATVAGLPNPFVVAHRCGMNVFPEETYEAADGCLAVGVDILDWDANLLNDGAIGMMHDDTINRTCTPASAATTSLTTMQWLNLNVTAGTWFSSAWPNTMKAPLVGAVLDRYGKNVLSIEAKTSSVVAPLIAAVQARGLTKSVIINTQILADIPTIKAAGIKAWYYFPTSSIASLASVVAAAPDGIIVQFTTTAADLATVVATGIPVLAGQTDRQSDWATFRAAGCVGLVTDEPAYTTNKHKKRTSDSWASKTPGHGYLSNLSVRPSFAGTAGIQFDGSGPFSCLIGEVSPTASGLITVDFFVTMTTLPTDNTRYIQLALTKRDSINDFVHNYTSGYAVNWRASGAIFTFRSDAAEDGTSGTSANITSKAGAPVTVPALNERRHMRLQITSTAVVATDVTTGAVATVNDTTHRPAGWYLTFGKSDTTGGVWVVDGLTIT